jgi:hypothetical protein
VSTSRPLTCPGFAATLDMFGYDPAEPQELTSLADEMRVQNTSHPVFEAIVIHLQQCDHCSGISDAQGATKVAKPRFGRVA